MPVDNAGNVYGFDLYGGMGVQDRVTQPPYSGPDAGTADLAPMAPNVYATDPEVNYLWYIAGVFAFLVLLKFASEHEKAKMSPSLAGVNVWNFVAVGTMSTLFIITAKTILNKYPVKGLTQLVNVA